MYEARVDQWVSAIDRSFDSAAREFVPDAVGNSPWYSPGSYEFSTLGPGAERHGVWEWVAHSYAARLDRYLILQVAIDTSDEPDAFTGDCPARLVGAAANTVHYASRTVVAATLRNIDSIPEFLFSAVPRTVAASFSFSADQLVGTYVLPRAMRRGRWPR